MLSVNKAMPRQRLFTVPPIMTAVNFTNSAGYCTALCAGSRLFCREKCAVSRRAAAGPVNMAKTVARILILQLVDMAENSCVAYRSARSAAVAQIATSYTL